jgi:hypothetical protein
MSQDEEPDRFADYPARGSVTNLCASASSLKSELRGKGGRLVVWGQRNTCLRLGVGRYGEAAPAPTQRKLT